MTVDDALNFRFINLNGGSGEGKLFKWKNEKIEQVNLKNLKINGSQ